MQPILVTGGTGTLGRHVVRRLRTAGNRVRVLTRGKTRIEDGVSFVSGDLRSGAGVVEAVEGVATIVHCAGGHSGDEVTTQTLVDAAARVGRPHIVYVSVVGADTIPVNSAFDRAICSYFAMKQRAEQIIIDSGLPWTTLRATQFYELVLTVAEYLAKLPVVLAPSRVSVQPVDADDVAEQLVTLAAGPPSGLAPDIAGPTMYWFTDFMREYLAATNRHGVVVPVRLPGQAAHALRKGALVNPDRAVGTHTWEDFLAQRLRRSAPPIVRASTTV